MRRVSRISRKCITQRPYGKQQMVSRPLVPSDGLHALVRISMFGFGVRDLGSGIEI